MLTAKQVRFVQNLIKGMSQREAYKNSYDASKMKDKTIDDKASLLFKQGEIRARYEELTRKLEDESIMSAKERMRWLTRVVNGDIKEKKYIYIDGEKNVSDLETDIGTKIKAIDTLNKMDGQYVQNIKADVNGQLELKEQETISNIESLVQQMEEIDEDDISE